MRGFGKGLMVVTCAGAAAVSVAACGGAAASGLPDVTSSRPPFTTVAPLPATQTPDVQRGDDDDGRGSGRGGPGRGGGDDRDEHDATAVSGPPGITASGVRATFACGNLTVTISGGDSDITLTGTCQSVTVTGNDDTVHSDAVGTITVTGSDDQVTWRSGGAATAPAVHDSGVDNTISRG